MSKILKTATAAGIITALLAGAPVLFAANPTNNAKDSGHMGMMMQGKSQMGNGMGMMNSSNMMPMMNMMTEMNQMMGTCNEMMQNMMKEQHGNRSSPKKG